LLKKLNLQFILLYLRYIWGSGLVENVIWGEGVGWKVRIPSKRGGGCLKLLKKRHMIFERSPTFTPMARKTKVALGTHYFSQTILIFVEIW